MAITSHQAIIYFLLGSFFVTLFSGQLIIAVFVIISIYLFTRSIAWRPIKKLIQNPLVIAWLFFWVWAEASYLWTIYPLETLSALMKLGIVTLVGLTAIAALVDKEPDETISLNGSVIYWMNGAIALLIIYEHLTGYQIALFLRELTGLTTQSLGQPMDKATVLYTLILPFILMLFAPDKKKLYILLAILALMYLLHPMFAATVAFFIAAIVAWLFRRFGRIVLRIVFTGMIAVYLLTPMILYSILPVLLGRGELQILPASWLERLQIWQRSSEIIFDKFFTGWGLNTSDYIERLAYVGEPNLITFHPHNIPLQLYMETGFIGSLLFSIVLLMMALSLRKIQDRNILTALVASFTAFSVFSLISINAWHSWWLASVFIIFVVALAFTHFKYRLQ